MHVNVCLGAIMLIWISYFKTEEQHEDAEEEDDDNE